MTPRSEQPDRKLNLTHSLEDWEPHGESQGRPDRPSVARQESAEDGRRASEVEEIADFEVGADLCL